MQARVQCTVLTTPKLHQQGTAKGFVAMPGMTRVLTMEVRLEK